MSSASSSISSDRRYNFSSGPSTLPEPVLRSTQAAIWNLAGSGIGILEHSHRGREFAEVLARAESRARQLANISDDYAVIFLASSATAQFYMAPMNFLPAGSTADYVHTGVWSGKAMEDARRVGNVHIAGSGEAGNFAAIPSSLTWSSAPAYAHYTSNNTIYGTQWAAPPTPPSGTPLLVDASSDMFSRPIDVHKHALIYAGAQKNLGPSGIVMAIVRRDLAAAAATPERIKSLPALMRYQTYVAENSLYNTPNTFGIFVIGEVLGWLLERGGLAGIEIENRAKAAVLYDFLDGSTVFRGHAEKSSRSLMNVTFRARTEAIEKELLAATEAAGMSGLAGHRSVGGLRASIYNAFPKSGVEKLVEIMDGFEKKYR